MIRSTPNQSRRAWTLPWCSSQVAQLAPFVPDLIAEWIEGSSRNERPALSGRKEVIAHVATEEMLHLALVQNLLSAVGAAPHLARPNLPAPAHHYPAGVNLTLVPLGEPALRHFMFPERPEGMELTGARGIIY